MKIKAWLFPLVIIMVMSSCGVFKTAQKAKNELYLKYEQLPSLGLTPVYTLSIFSNGSAELEAKDQMELNGFYKVQISEDEFMGLQKAVNSLNVDTLQNVYDAQVRDVPVHITTFKIGQKYKTVRNRYGAPHDLILLERKLNALVFKAQWQEL